MPLIVEFFGIPRQRAGVASLAIGDDERPATVAQLWRQVGERLPALVGPLRPHYAVNLDGERFVDDPDTCLAGVTHVLVLSADAGG